ncbi:50S ribosomal protein L4 [Planctopirus ephydatiae]|uniref:Large ribosomal subunit protein uL4 n=1 Tax=Planctopirus ephydatiae TaxID=2528019 RepID=A0A518GLC5_9PLAN|nr:50S ribosomal protein L4 [Planctopirus ephydatiae]QDV29368.1 50S ribosomal protein L4 [Planctopirus ephydatiae]
MISLPIHTSTGEATGRNYEFDPAELADSINKQLLHDAVVMYQANLRQGTFKSKSRAEIAGSKQKLFKQKGTGRARQGNKRQPVRRGGGHAFAKRPTDFSYRLPRKALQLATRMALLGKFQDNEVTIIESLSLEAPKTKIVATLLNKLGLESKSCLISIPTHDSNVWKSARNIPKVGVSPAAGLNAYQLLLRKQLVVTTGALDMLRRPAQ